MIAGVTGHARTEGNFYTQVRPELELEIPRGYHSTVDRDSFGAIHRLEDVASSRGAVFCDYRTKVSLEMTEAMVDPARSPAQAVLRRPALRSDFGPLHVNSLPAKDMA